MQLEGQVYYDREMSNGKGFSFYAWYNVKGIDFGASVSIFPKDRVGISLDLGVFGFDISLDWY